MQFNSFQFLVFFPVTLLIYFTVPKKLRYLWLLAASYYFYMSWSVKYSLLLLFSTTVTYGGSLLIHKYGTTGEKRKAKLTLTAVLALNFGILVYFKYANFLLSSLEVVLHALSIPASFSAVDVLLPVGISFYIFQAVGYSFDVYYGKLAPETNLLRYALFVSYFPQLVAGPIERSGNLLPQLKNVESIKLWDGKRIRRGALLMLYGFILKMIISDRCAIAVDEVFNNCLNYTAGAYVAAALLFTVQIYCDFAGYTYIAIGTSRIMGVELMNNFNSPYLAVSIKDFWNRWHISLSTWFKDYLYIPLGGSRKGRLRKCFNLFVVFAVSGLWHGAGWNFILWGIIHAIYRIAEELTAEPRKELRQRLGIAEDNPLLMLVQRLVTFCLVAFAWLFFRIQNFDQLKYMVYCIFMTTWQLGSIWSSGIGAMALLTPEWKVLAVSLVFLAVSDILREKKIPFSDWFEARSPVFRAATFILGILLILTFGIYGSSYDPAAFIYFQF
ncbi:MAG: MBOAT family O-acyltransferase [Eubacteriales bacterium]|nr:MBOAT family O-acyltransferase [Eubacteriales bacterium]